MQTVKNLYLWHRPLGTVRKLVELPLAVYFDAVLSKKRIIEIYLNIAEWAPNVYGIEAAAQHHFGKPAKSLTARQAALLAVTLPNPIDRNPAKPSAGVKTSRLDHPEARRQCRQPRQMPAIAPCRGKKIERRCWSRAGRACIGTPTFRPWSGIAKPSAKGAPGL